MNMKNVQRLNESRLRAIITGPVKKTLTETDCELHFIDKDEIKEMLGEYYNFSNVSEYAWKTIDNLIQSECERRGVSSNDYESYARVCDVIVGKVLK